MSVFQIIMNVCAEAEDSKTLGELLSVYNSEEGNRHQTVARDVDRALLQVIESVGGAKQQQFTEILHNLSSIIEMNTTPCEDFADKDTLPKLDECIRVLYTHCKSENIKMANVLWQLLSLKSVFLFKLWVRFEKKQALKKRYKGISKKKVLQSIVRNKRKLADKSNIKFTTWNTHFVGERLSGITLGQIKRFSLPAFQFGPLGHVSNEAQLTSHMEKQMASLIEGFAGCRYARVESHNIGKTEFIPDATLYRTDFDGEESAAIVEYKFDNYIGYPKLTKGQKKVTHQVLMSAHAAKCDTISLITSGQLYGIKISRHEAQVDGRFEFDFGIKRYDEKENSEVTFAAAWYLMNIEPSGMSDALQFTFKCGINKEDPCELVRREEGT